jgi:hypothetical protein
MKEGQKLLEAALYYANLGYKVFPLHYIKENGRCSCPKHNCESQGKHPYYGNCVSIKFKENASSDSKQIEKWWTNTSMINCNIGIITGPENNLSVLDIDIHNGKPGMEEFEKLKERFLTEGGETFPDDNPIVVTGSGGLQIYFNYHKDVNNSSALIAPGLDTRGKGGYVVAPPSFNVGGQYAWKNWIDKFPTKPCPQIIADELIAKKKAPKYSHKTIAGASSGAIAASSKIPSYSNDSILKGVAQGQRDEILFKYACRLKTKGLSKKEVTQILLNAAKNCTPPFPKSEALQKVESAFRYTSNSTSGSVQSQLISNGKPIREIKFSDINGNRIPNTFNNLKSILDHYDIRVRYNEMSKEQEIDIPGMSFISDMRRNNEIAHIESLCCLHSFPTSNISQYLGILAKEFHPVRDWIESKPWDGNSRIPRLMETIECESDDIRDLYLGKWLVSAVAALYEPGGISAQGVLIFSGGQGIGKTRWLKSLVGNQNQDWCKDGAILSPGNKDSVYGVITKWLVELGEMESTFKKSDVEQLKAFITKDSDEMRLPYERKPEKYPRRTVFFGSVNSEQFLVDNTGNRRYWTLRVDGCNWEHYINMQQLWAEIYSLYKNGQKYYLDNFETLLVNQENQKFELVDPFEQVFFDEFIIPGSIDDKHPHRPVISIHATDIYKECFDTKNPARKDVNNAIKILSKHNIKTKIEKKTKLYQLKRKS